MTRKVESAYLVLRRITSTITTIMINSPAPVTPAMIGMGGSVSAATPTSFPVDDDNVVVVNTDGGGPCVV